MSEAIKHTIGAGKLKIHLLPTGDIHSIAYGDFFVSLYKGNSLAGGLSNLFLRVTAAGKTWSAPLIGANSPSVAEVYENGVIYRGSISGVEYEVRLNATGDMWFWTVTAAGAKGFAGEIFLGQDVGLCAPNLNEAYVSQYLDHRAVEEENGFHIIT